MPGAFSFHLLATDGAARRGEIATPHGPVATPVFMPVGTQATVKGLTPEAVHAAGADIVLANTYHLMLRPGAERIAALGGLHQFMNWPHAVLTDSGGFQVMSLSELRKVEEKGVTFRSHLDGAMRLSLAWAERSKRAFEGSAREGHALFGIVQGGDDATLRVESARALVDIDFHGYAIGGLAVGEPQEVMLRLIGEVAPVLPPDRPRYLMGVGTPGDII